MEAAGLRAIAEGRQSEVDAVLARSFSLAKKRAEPLGRECVELSLGGEDVLGRVG